MKVNEMTLSEIRAVCAATPCVKCPVFDRALNVCRFDAPIKWDNPETPAQRAFFQRTAIQAINACIDTGCEECPGDLCGGEVCAARIPSIWGQFSDIEAPREWKEIVQALRGNPSWASQVQ